MMLWLRLAEKVAHAHILSTIVKVAAKAAKFVFHSNVGLIALSAAAARIGL